MYKTFKDFSDSLNESFVNAFSEKDKAKYVDQIWALLQAAYESQGGLQGSGFESKQDMIDKIPFWKIGKTSGIVNSVAMYKDKEGRKRVAIATNGTPEGRNRLLEMMKDDLVQHRAYVELSGRSLSFLAKNLDVLKYVVKPEDVKKKLHEDIRPVPEDDPEIKLHPELKDYFYQRSIGKGIWHTKLMLGNINAEGITV